jgi:hypothetical protein
MIEGGLLAGMIAENLKNATEKQQGLQKVVLEGYLKKKRGKF